MTDIEGNSANEIIFNLFTVLFYENKCAIKEAYIELFTPIYLKFNIPGDVPYFFKPDEKKFTLYPSLIEEEREVEIKPINLIVESTPENRLQIVFIIKSLISSVSFEIRNKFILKLLLSGKYSIDLTLGLSLLSKSLQASITNSLSIYSGIFPEIKLNLSEKTISKPFPKSEEEIIIEGERISTKPFGRKEILERQEYKEILEFFGGLPGEKKKRSYKKRRKYKEPYF